MGEDVLVVGAGALGIGLAVPLHHAGHRVTVALRDEASAQAMPDQLTHIDPKGVAHRAQVRQVHAPDTSRYDVIVIATKCDDAAAAIATWRPALRAGGALVCLQNGVMGDDLSASAGDALVECTVAYPATLLERGVSEQTAPGDLIVGPWPDGRMEHASGVEIAARVLSDAMPTRIHMNMRGVKWTKLLINSAITGLGVATGKTLGSLLEDRRARDAFLHIFTEGHRVGVAQGIRFEPVGGLRPAVIAVGRPTRLGLFWRHALLRALGRKYRRQKSSSLQSLEQGKKTEILHLNGRIAAEGAQHGIATPVNDAVVALVADIEAGASRPSMEHLDRIPWQFH